MTGVWKVHLVEALLFTPLAIFFGVVSFASGLHPVLRVLAGAAGVFFLLLSLIYWAYSIQTLIWYVRKRIEG